MTRSDVEKLISGISKEDAVELAHALRQYAKTGVIPEASVCVECGTAFFGARESRQYCSQRCRSRVGERRRYAIRMQGYDGRIATSSTRRHK